MIKYQLICHQEHEFEGWFSDSASFTSQVEKQLVDCPLCGSHQVRRALTAPNLNSPKMRKSAQDASQTLPLPSSMTARPSADNGEAMSQVEAMGQAMTALRQLHKKIQADFTNVGEKFATEARKMHYGETEAKPIYGTSTNEEREELAEEGIEFYQLPDAPNEH